MTRDDILRMAREAGFEQVMRHKDGSSTVLPTAMFERFAALVAEADRETIQNPQLTDGEMDLVITEIGRFDREEIGFNGLTAAIVKIAIKSADAIRARGTK